MSAVIVVDGVELPERLIAEEAQNHPGPTIEAARTAAGHALAIKALLLDRAHQLGLTAEAELDEDGRESECRRVYDSAPDRFRTPRLTQASHILCAPKGDDAAAWAAAEVIARTAIAELAQHPSRFAALATALSDCPSKGVGGSLGQLSPGDLAPEVEAGLDRLQAGETASEPVRSRFGWHILRLDRRIDGQRLPFEHVQPQISLHLESRAWTAAATRYVSGLAAEARERGVALTVTIDGTVSNGALSLGDLLNNQAAVAARLEAWLDEADPALAARAREVADAAGIGFAAFVQREIAHFAQGADDERWTRLISAAQGSSDPALACVQAILKSKLAVRKNTFTLIRRN